MSKREHTLLPVTQAETVAIIEQVGYATFAIPGGALMVFDDKASLSAALLVARMRGVTFGEKQGELTDDPSPAKEA